MKWLNRKATMLDFIILMILYAVFVPLINWWVQ